VELVSLTRQSRDAKATGVAVRCKSSVADEQPTNSKAARLEARKARLILQTSRTTALVTRVALYDGKHPSSTFFSSKTWPRSWRRPLGLIVISASMCTDFRMIPHENALFWWCPSIAWMKGRRSDVDRSRVEPGVHVGVVRDACNFSLLAFR
jgi:hypothetical protein